MDIYHEFLVDGQSFDESVQRVELFLGRTQLVRYQKVNVLKGRCLQGTDETFQQRLEMGTNENRRFLREILEELEENGFERLSQLKLLPQGYPSKLIHIASHILDGFFGIDSYLYNLIEDSHWVSDELLNAIKNRPTTFWLIAFEAACVQGLIGKKESQKTSDAPSVCNCDF